MRVLHSRTTTGTRDVSSTKETHLSLERHSAAELNSARVVVESLAMHRGTSRKV